MKPISAAQCSSIVFYLNKGYSHCQIQAKTGAGKGTVGRISMEVESDKENNNSGCPSKLSTHDEIAIIQEIHSGMVDNAVQATQFINSTLSNPVSTQTIWNTLKKIGFFKKKKKVSMLKKAHHQRWLESAEYHRKWT
jgi:transposase